MDAVLLGVLAGALFGAMTVAVRWGLLRGGDPMAGAPVIAFLAFAATLPLALAVPGASDPDALAAFLAVGVVVPGVSQVVFVGAVRFAGPARAAILIGTAPLVSVLLAVALLDESFDAATLAGTVLVVFGGAALAFDKGRPVGFRMLGVVFALVCAVLFAARDNAVRHFAVDLDIAPLDAAAASLLGATLGSLAVAAVVRRRELGMVVRSSVSAFAPAGVLLGAAYCALVAGFDRGSVGLVAPLNATQSLWAILLAAVVYKQAEAIGRRTVLAATLVVAGGALVVGFR